MFLISLDYFKIFFLSCFLQFKYDMLFFLLKPYLLFSEFLMAVAWSQSFILKHSLILFKYFFCTVLTLFSFWYSNYAYAVLFLYYHTVLRCPLLFFFFIFFLFKFKFEKIVWPWSQAR